MIIKKPCTFRKTKMKNRPIQVEIDNFQSIQNAKFEINGLTVLVGKSNLGKSAVVRALSHCLLNQSVVGMVRKGASHVRVKFDDGENEIVWEKGEKKINRYHINGKLYDKVERKQLEPIQNMGFGSITIGDSKLQPWYSSQFEPIFLLDKTGPQVTNFISEISRLRIVQDAIVFSARGKKKENDGVKGCDSELEQVYQKLDAFDDLDKIESLWADIEDQRNSIIEYESKVNSMKHFRSSLVENSEKIRSLLPSASVSLMDLELNDDMRSLSAMSSFNKELKELVKRIIPLRSITSIGNLESPDQEYKTWESISKFSSLPTKSNQVRKLLDINKVVIPDLESGFEEKISDLHSMKDFKRKIHDLEKGIQSSGADKIKIPEIDISNMVSDIHSQQDYMITLSRLHDEILKLKSEQSSVGKELDLVMSQLSEFNACPLCGQELNSDHSKEAAREVGIASV